MYDMGRWFGSLASRGKRALMGLDNRVACSQQVEMVEEANEAYTKTLKMIGFKALLGWHYLVLFTPLFIGTAAINAPSLFFQRQVTLYLTLAVTFGILVLVGKRMLRKNRTAPSKILLVSAGALATLATIVSATTMDFPVPLRLGTVVLLGVSEALLMFLWLHYYVRAAANYLTRSFAVDMIFGGLVALLVCSLQEPIGLIAAVLLPLVAITSLMANWRTAEPLPPTGFSDAFAPLSRKAIREFALTSVPTMVYAFAFGLLQGAYLVDGTLLLMANEPLILVGIALAGACIIASSLHSKQSRSIDAIHRYSLLLFVVGIVLLPFFREGFGALTAECVILAGFNLFDFGGVIIGIGIAQRLRSDSLLLVDGGRVVAYLCLAVGCIVGDQLMMLFMDQHGWLVLIGVGGVAIAMLVATVLTPFHEWEELASDGADAQAAAPASQPEPTSADDAARASSFQKPQAPAVKAASSEDGEPASRGKSAKPEGGYVDSPWRRTCQRIAELYKLSPRETEIFFFIAKGRNAEYVQQELVISMHTAKTHIANIYHKLGVHSSQEMLTLIETFRREDIEKQGAKLGERKAVKD